MERTLVDFGLENWFLENKFCTEGALYLLPVAIVEAKAANYEVDIRIIPWRLDRIRVVYV